MIQINDDIDSLSGVDFLAVSGKQYGIWEFVTTPWSTHFYAVASCIVVSVCSYFKGEVAQSQEGKSIELHGE
jgi:hypothetical protein